MSNHTTETTTKSVSWTKGQGTTKVTETRTVEAPKVETHECGCRKARAGAVDFGCQCDTEWDEAAWSRMVD